MVASMASRSAKPEPSVQRNGTVAAEPDRVLVGEIGKAHGLRGEVKVEVHSDIAERFVRGSELWVVKAGRPAGRLTVLQSRPVKGGLLVAFDGIADRDQAEALSGSRLEVDSDQVPAAPDGLYYYFELLGCRCVDAELGDLGEVIDVVEDGGGTLLQVARGEEKLLLPFVDAFLGQVDTAGKRIEWRLPAGLVETCTSKS